MSPAVVSSFKLPSASNLAAAFPIITSGLLMTRDGGLPSSS